VRTRPSTKSCRGTIHPKTPIFLTDFKKIACYTKVEAIGDNEFVRDEAVQRTKEAIHILNLYCGSSTHQDKLKSIGVSQLIVHRALPDDEHQNSDMRFLESYPSQVPFEIDLKKENSWAQMDLKTMNSCFQPHSNSDIKKRVQRATIGMAKPLIPTHRKKNLLISLLP